MSNDDAQAAGERVETLIAELRSQAGPQAAATAEELVSCLVELYGTGLATILASSGCSSIWWARTARSPTHEWLRWSMIPEGLA